MHVIVRRSRVQKHQRSNLHVTIRRTIDNHQQNQSDTCERSAVNFHFFKNDQIHCRKGIRVKSF